jgi:hypothetical protein
VIRTRSALLAVSAWTVGAAAAVGVGLLALSLVGSTFLNGPTDPLAQAGTPLPTTQPSGTTSDPAVIGPMPTAESSTVTASGPAGGTERQLSSAGGSVLARCTADGAYLVLWSPAQGYHAGDVIRGPAATARVEFESLTSEIKVVVICVGGVPQANVSEEGSH